MSKQTQNLFLLNELKIIESQFTKIIDIADDAIVSVNEKQIIILFNSGAEKVFGYKREEVIGKNLSFLIPNRYHDNHMKHVKDFGREENSSKLMSDRNAIFGVRKNGEEFQAEASISNVKLDGKSIYTVILRDISRQKELEKRLENSYKRLESIIMLADDAILTVNSEQKIIMFNRGAENLFGYSQQEIKGKELSLLLPVRYREVHKRHMREFAKYTDSARMMADRTDIYGLRKDGVEFAAEASISNIKVFGENLFTVILRDITSRKLMEVSYKKYHKELQEINENKNKYFSVVAHDLRSPFSGIVGYINYMNDNIDKLERNEFKDILNNLSKVSNKITTLLENLLDWTLIQMEKASFNPEYILISEIIGKEVSVLSLLSENKAIKIINKVNESVSVYTDANMLGVIIRNLLSNAVKYSKNSNEIFIFESDNSSKNVIEINVQDFGVGMSESAINDLFKLDKINSSSGTNQEKGTGIGLIICKEFVSKIGGTMKISSEENKGTTVSFTIPKFEASE